MKKNALIVCLLAGMLVPGFAFAQDQAEEAEGGFSWTAAATSEYLFRGVSQTDDHPALQVSAEYEFSNGIYLGAWASNVDFNDSTDAEVDTYIGWRTALNESVALDVQLNRYNYINEPSDVDYAFNELIGVVSFNDQYEVTLGYTNNYLNADVKSTYLGVGGAWELGDGYNLSASVGHTINSGDFDSYTDYAVGVDRTFGPVNIGLQYIGTDSKAERLFGEDASENKFVLTFSLEG